MPLLTSTVADFYKFNLMWLRSWETGHIIHTQTSFSWHLYKLCPHMQIVVHLPLSPKIYEQVKLKWAQMPCTVMIIMSIYHTGDTITLTIEYASLYTEAFSQVTEHSSSHMLAYSIIETQYG